MLPVGTCDVEVTLNWLDFSEKKKMKKEKEKGLKHYYSW